MMRGDDGGGEDGGERTEVVVWHRERLDVHQEVGESRGDVGGKEEVVERSEEEVECEGELRVMRGDVMGIISLSNFLKVPYITAICVT